MMEIEIVNVEKAIKMLNPDIPEQASRAAAMRTLNKLKTRIKRETAAMYEVRQKDVASTSTAFQVEDGGMLKFVGARIVLSAFKPRIKMVPGIRKKQRQQVSVQIKKGQRKVLKDGFMIDGVVYKRGKKGGRRYKTRVSTIAIPTMITQAVDEDEAQVFIEEDYKKQLQNQMQFRINKALGM